MHFLFDLVRTFDFCSATVVLLYRLVECSPQLVDNDYRRVSRSILSMFWIVEAESPLIPALHIEVQIVIHRRSHLLLNHYYCTLLASPPMRHLDGIIPQRYRVSTKIGRMFLYSVFTYSSQSRHHAVVLPFPILSTRPISHHITDCESISYLSSMNRGYKSKYFPPLTTKYKQTKSRL